MNLKPYAAHHLVTKGRRFKEPLSPLRNEFQRDRDRIIHCTSFRRLQYKTQVFVSHEGDMFRNRLTHSLEVSQVSRGIARTLGCHEDLAEAIALAHDLGHPPFGHAGQDALNCCMKNFGGFEHNLQSLRVVDQIESRYVNFAGLNLTFETREGILKHCSKKNAKDLGSIGERFLQNTEPSLEAQIVNVADEIAYCHHDIDDGFRSGILDFDLLRTVDLFNSFYLKVMAQFDNISPEQMINETIRKMMHFIIADLCSQSIKKINEYAPECIDEVRQCPPLICFSTEVLQQMQELKKFSRTHLYNHPRILKMSKHAHLVVHTLFDYYLSDLDKVPQNYRYHRDDAPTRVVADYIAGMTDRFAMQSANEIN